MDKATRNAIERATQQSRKLLDEDFSSQLAGTFDVLRSGVIAPKGGVHLSARQQFQRDKIVAAIDHKRAAGTTAAEAVTDYVRDVAFTTLNRFVALKMLEARQLVQECIHEGRTVGRLPRVLRHGAWGGFAPRCRRLSPLCRKPVRRVLDRDQGLV